MSELTVKDEEGTTSFSDEKGRIVMSISSDGRMVAGRYPDMDDECKEFIVQTFEELINQDAEKTRRFLNFEDDEDVFCT